MRESNPPPHPRGGSGVLNQLSNHLLVNAPKMALALVVLQIRHHLQAATGKVAMPPLLAIILTLWMPSRNMA